MNRLLLFLFLTSTIGLKAQSEKAIGDIIEQMAQENQEEDLNNDVLYYYLKQPIKMDENCRAKLEELGILNQIQLTNLEEHIRQYGSIRAIEEMFQIKGMDIHTIERIRPFISIGNTNLQPANTVDKMHHHHLRYRRSEFLQKSKAFSTSENGYLGSPTYMNLRYLGKFYSKIETSLNLEKDIGEELWTKERNVDFVSAYISVKNVGKFKQVIVGDYGASFGQGLTFSTIGGMGKTSEVLLIAKQFNDVKVHRSNSESNYLRGMATTMQFGKTKMTSFVSHKRIDATIIQDNTENKVSSIYASGLHRTENELQKIGALKEDIVGINLVQEEGNIKLGLIGIYKHYSLPFKEKSTWYGQKRSLSNERLKGGTYISIEKNNYHLFGEFSKGLNSGHGIYTGIIIMPHSKFSTAISFRNYMVNFHSSHSAAFGEKRDNTNEEGLYASIKYVFRHGRSLSFYCDLYKHKFPEFSSNSGSSGIDYLTQFIMPLSREDEILIRVKWEEKEKNGSSEMANIQLTELKRGIRFQYVKTLNKTLRWRLRSEFTEFIFGNQKEHGSLMFNELKYKKMMSPWTFLGRFTLFDTDSHESSIYAYEQGVSGTFSVPAFSGKGSKVLALIKYKWSRHLTMSACLGHIVYDDRKTIGSGLDEISGSARTSLSCQIEIKY